MAFENYTAARPSQSSTSRGWQGLLVRTFNEPNSIEYNFAPGTPDAFISLIISGEAQIACRTDGGKWEETRIRPGCFHLKAPGTPSEWHGNARLKTDNDLVKFFQSLTYPSMKAGCGCILRANCGRTN